MFNFDFKNSYTFALLKAWSVPLVKYARIFAWLCFCMFVFSLLAIGFSFFELIFIRVNIEVPLVLLMLFFIFWELDIFFSAYVENYQKELPLQEAIKNPSNYNLAEFLDLQSCDVVHQAVNMCRKRNLSPIISQALLYSLVAHNNKARKLFVRLGMDVKKLEIEIKNDIEKQPRQKSFELVFSDAFEKTIMMALKIASDRNKSVITEKELLIGLAYHDAYFKKVLIEYDLKESDIENLTLWLDGDEALLREHKKFWTKESLVKFGSIGQDFSAGFTVTLDEFSTDLRERAKHNIIKEIIGHKTEIEEIETVLIKSRLSNVLIVGEEGAGRKSLVEAVAKRCYLGLGIPELSGKRVVELDMVSLLSRIQDSEKLETTLDRILSEALSAGNIILVINSLDHFIGQSTMTLGSADISGILAKYLAMPRFHFIGITTFEGLHQHLEKSTGLLEYFRNVELQETSEMETIQILQNAVSELEHVTNIFVPYPTIREVVNLSTRYFPSLPFPKKAVDILEEAVALVKSQKEKTILPHHIAQIVSDKTHIPVGKMDIKEKSVLLNLENLIRQRIVGQSEAVGEISMAMRRSRSGISSKKRPMGSFLFLGPTGVGKTETAKALSQIYFNGEDKMIRLDMSEFQAISDIPRLIGAVSPIEEQGLLTTPVREKPFSLVLIDELEKAHKDILNLFLQILDEGYITDGHGRKVFFTNTIIICTSNAGASAIFKSVADGKLIEKTALLDMMFDQGIFRPEFINRFDATIIFHPLTKENLMDIAQINLASLAKSLNEKDIELVITGPLKEKIVELSYKPEFGARQMRRVMQDKVENAVAQALLSDVITKGDKIEINPENFTVVKL